METITITRAEADQKIAEAGIFTYEALRRGPQYVNRCVNCEAETASHKGKRFCNDCDSNVATYRSKEAEKGDLHSQTCVKRSAKKREMESANFTRAEDENGEKHGHLFGVNTAAKAKKILKDSQCIQVWKLSGRNACTVAVNDENVETLINTGALSVVPRLMPREILALIVNEKRYEIRE